MKKNKETKKSQERMLKCAECGKIVPMSELTVILGGGWGKGKPICSEKCLDDYQHKEIRLEDVLKKSQAKLKELMKNPSKNKQAIIERKMFISGLKYDLKITKMKR